MSSRLKCLVTGGAGFVGHRLVQALVDTGEYEVTVLDLYPPTKDRAFPPEVQFQQGDLTKEDDVMNACKGVQIVFHVATAAPSAANSLSESLMKSVNIDGTHHVIDACVHHGVQKLVYTSTASVAFDGSDILYKTEEELGYAAVPVDHYTGTKMKAEQLVLAANGRGGKLLTCALRPSAIFGEGDAMMVPTLVARARQGKMKYLIGDGENLMDFTYVGNVVQAHLLAAEKLQPGSPVAGQAYFITNQEPRKFWEFSGDLIHGLGYDRPHVKLPVWLMLFLVFILQCIITPLLRPIMKIQSDLTLNRVRLITRNRAFNPQKAKDHLSYVPKVSMDEAAKRTIAAFEHLRKGKS